MLNVENVATPLTAFTLVVPASVPPPGFAPGATTTDPQTHHTTVRAPPIANTRTAVSVGPAVVVFGCVVKPTWVAAGPAARSSDLLALVAPVSPLALAVSV